VAIFTIRQGDADGVSLGTLLRITEKLGMPDAVQPKICLKKWKVSHSLKD